MRKTEEEMATKFYVMRLEPKRVGLLRRIGRWISEKAAAWVKPSNRKCECINDTDICRYCEEGYW